MGRVANRLCCMALALVLLLSGSIFVHDTASATGAAEQLRIQAIRVINPDVQKPGVVTVEIDFTESGIGVQYFDLQFVSMTGHYLGGTFHSVYPHGDEAYGGTITRTIPVPTNSREETYQLSYIIMGDFALNQSIYVRQDDGRMYLQDPVGERNSFPGPEFHVTDEFDVEFDYALSNPRLISRIKSLPEGKTGKILINDPTNCILPKAAFDAIKGKDKTIVLYRDEVQWVINGKDINKPTKNVNLSLTATQVNGTKYGIENDVVALQFHPNGELPGKVTIRVKSDYAYNMYGVKGKLYLYYAGKDGLQEEQSNIELVLDDGDKWCFFDITHNSKFIITDQKKPPVSPKSVSLSSKKLTVDVGKSKTLKATVKPANTTDKKITWKSANTKIATVDENGKVKGVKVGSTRISATTANGKKTVSCTVKVVAPVTSIVVPQTKIYLKKGSSATLATVPVTTDGSTAKITWKSSAPKVVSVNSKGKVKALKKGKATITAKAENGKSVKITVNVGGKSPTSVSIKSLPKGSAMKIGETMQLNIAIKPKTARGVVRFKSSRDDIVSVDTAGQIRALKKGSATITVSLGKKKCKLKIKVS